MSFQFLLTSPDEIFVDQIVSQVVVCTVDGEMSYLVNHWDSIVEVDIGLIKVYMEANAKPVIFAVDGGIASFKNNTLTVNTIEADKIEGRKPDYKLFPATIKAKESTINEQITEALKNGGVYDENKGALSALLAEERLAKVQILQEMIKGF
jgi:F0F1-type ATP synthase epsilon subunit